MASPPSAEATLHPRFGAIGEARQAAIAARSTFFDERIRDGFSGLLWTAGTACTRCCRHAATAHARSCQAEIAADTPLPPTASSKSKARGLGLLHGRRLSHGCATLGSNFWDTALELLRALLTRHPTLANLEEAARRLDQYYVPTRYPNGLPGGTPADVFSKAQATEALAQAKRFVEVAGALIG